MPRKHAQHWSHIKPTPSASPSASATSSTPSGPKSVNTLLASLRVSLPYLPSSTTSSLPPTAPSVPPPLQTLLGTPAPAPPPPRARPGTAANRRRAPGPPAPASWLLPRPPPAVALAPGRDAARFQGFSRLPGLVPPPKGSLQALALRAIAAHWRWHAEWDADYLCRLPARLRSVLVRMLGREADMAALEILFPAGVDAEGEAEEAEEATVLDLSLSALSVRQVVALLAAPAVADGEETWDGPAAGGRFRGVTHLALPPPRSTADWEALPRLGARVTHLSVADWTVLPGEGGLKRVARGLLGVKWIDFGGQVGEGEVGERLMGERERERERLVEELGMVEWGGAWRAVETVVVGAGREEVRGVIRAERRRRGGGWVEVLEG
ncbi:hypothetical protein EDC01DRAFT_790268 [Geopyxis carbonaria]|nr:hypothetical protein EDC01DRAFT_790268 [Geopyxis carbonaria]